MAFSESLARRIRDALSRNKGITEKTMFSGLGFFLHGNFLVGVWKNSLVARLGPEQGAEALRQPHVRAFDVTGKPMKGWALVEPEGLDEDNQLKHRIDRAENFVSTLPRK